MRRRFETILRRCLDIPRQSGLPSGALAVALLVVVAGGASNAEPTAAPGGTAPLSIAAFEASSSWVVLDAVGDAVWRPQESTEARRFERGQTLPAGSVIETGPGSRVELVSGGDELVLASSSRLIVPEVPAGRGPRLRHEFGRLQVHVEPRPSRDFRVLTPLLSMGIKGTRFEVAVDGAQNSVLVHEGEVAVETPGSTQPIPLQSGEGLRQPAEPSAEAVRFRLPSLSASPGDSTGVDWHLPEPAPAPRSSQGRLDAPPVDQRLARVDHSADDAGRLEEWINSPGFLITLVALAAGALLVLGMPSLVLGKNLRDLWLNRARAKGRRRRRLIRGW